MTERHRTRAFWTVCPGRGEVREERLPVPGPGEARLQALYSAVSRGTETLVFSGRVPAAEYQRMRAPHQVGELPGPVKYGYASVARVVEGPPSLIGRVMFCLYPHQEQYVVDCAALHAVPAAVPAARAVLAANMETALNGLWDAGVLPGDRIAVIGAGSIGCLCAWLARRIAGCEVQLIDINPARASVAAALGVAFALPEAARQEVDLVLHASGAPEGLALALRLAGAEACIVELSWYGTSPVTLPLGEAFHASRLQIRSSQVGTLPARQRARWTRARRLQLALSLLTDPALEALVNSEGPLEALPGTLAQLASGPGEVIIHRVRYEVQES